MNENTKSIYGQGLQSFCEWCKEKPETLLEIRFTRKRKILLEFRAKHKLRKPVTSESDDGSKAVADLPRKFLTEGTVSDNRKCMHSRIIKIGKQSEARRTILDNAVRRFFRH